jgi:hypothetical protein
MTLTIKPAPMLDVGQSLGSGALGESITYFDQVSTRALTTRPLDSSPAMRQAAVILRPIRTMASATIS